MSWTQALVGCWAVLGLVQCGHGNSLSVDSSQTFAELRAIKGELKITPAGSSPRAPLERERLVEGETVTLPEGALAWMRRDAGATWLVKGPARFTAHANRVELTEGRAFVDTESGPPVVVDTKRSPIELADARASIEVRSNGETSVYVLRGSARAGSAGRAGPGELITLNLDGTAARKAEIAWDDWTGGLATADAAAQPAPFGMGTVGARPAGDKGKPRFSLAIQRLDVNVTIDHDFATTEVDQTFVNPSSDTVEGMFSFRTPATAVLQRFGVDRAGELVWGYIKESASAAKQYESNVYAGSTEDPALLQWAGPGAYNARLYPIESGTTRRVVTRYSEWLSRQGPNGERRLYVYPMAAEGAKGSLPRIEELTVSFDLSRASAKTVRAGMGGKREGDRVVVKAFDFVPRADLSLELFDGGQTDEVAYRAKHALSADALEKRDDSDFAKRVSSEEPDYLLVPLRSHQAPALPSSGLDLAIVVDTSAATEPGALAIARSMAAALLTHLGPNDRAALWTGDATLRPVVDGSGTLGAIDPEKRRQWLAALSSVERGGATDLGALLAEAASKLDPQRSSAVLYIGDGQPTVGELVPKSLRERLARLPQSTRLLVAALGSNANLPLLSQLTRGAPVESIGDAYGAARAALRILEAASRPLWLGATVELGPEVERLLPRELPPIGPEQSVLAVGRIKGNSPTQVTLRSGGASHTSKLSVVELDDFGDLRRRWGQARLSELIEQGSGRSSLVELGLRFGLVSPFTSIYVPTKRETEDTSVSAQERQQELADRRRRWKPWVRLDEEPAAERENSAIATIQQQLAPASKKEGGTGTRAKGEEGSMGNPSKRYAVQDNPDPHVSRAAALREAEEFGMIGLVNSGASSAPGEPEGAQPAAPPPAAAERETESVAKAAAKPAARMSATGAGAAVPSPGEKADELSARGNMWGDEVGDAKGAAGIGLSSLGHGFGSGHGRLGGAHGTSAPKLRQGPLTVSGRLPPEVISRILRQNWGRFRLCYEAGLSRNPNLEGRAVTSFTIGNDGAVSNVRNGGSDIPDAGVVNCIISAHSGLSFPQPESGIVTVVSTLTLSPGQGAPSRPNTKSNDDANSMAEANLERRLGGVGHAPRPCGAGADLPLDERRSLWRERLSGASSAEAATEIYIRAIADCETPGWHERQYLLVMMVDRMPSVRERVALWRGLRDVASAADVIFRSILVRVQSAEQLRELHDALGWKQMDPTLLANLVSKRKSTSERLALLHGAALRWPDDLELALQVLDAYEDAGDIAGGRAWARRLRRRIDATAHVHTNVGEYYLRLSERESGAERERDANEARRSFGELVEFAPEDPAARRRLGDLLRAHGWYEEAFRQYETLAQLTPDDPTVPLLLAAAANGMGKVEQAVGWVNKSASVGSPEGKGELSRAAHATASAFLAWAFEDAKKSGRAAEAQRLFARARSFASGTVLNGPSVRFILTWAHPELHPSLWSSMLGGPAPASDNFPLFGVAEVALSAATNPSLEIRLDTEDANRAARLGAEAIVTAIAAEGTPEQRVARLNVKFGRPGEVSERIQITWVNGGLHQEAL